MASDITFTNFLSMPSAVSVDLITLNQKVKIL